MARNPPMRAIVLGLELNGLSVVRSLARNRVKVIGVDSDLEQISSLTKYLVSRVRTQDIRGPSVVDTLIDLGRGGHPHAVFPTMDATVLLLSEARDRLPANLVLRLPEKECLRRLMHKGSFRALCREHGLPSPGYALADSRDALEEALGGLRFPVVMKAPIKRYGHGAKAALVPDLESALSAYADQGAGEVILEEWIPGGDGDVFFCLQAYGADGGLLASFAGRKIRQWPPRVGGTASAEPVDEPELEERTTRFFQAVGYRGIGSMEYKRDARDGTFYAVEPTVGRTDFQSGIAPANGVNIPLAAFCEMAGQSYRARRRRRKVKWVDPVGDARAAAFYMEEGSLTRAQWRRSLSGPCVSALFAFDDPGPWVSDLFRRALGRVRRSFRPKKGGAQ